MASTPQVRGIRLTIPNPRNPSDPNNLQAIERWANTQVVNQIVAGTNVTISSQVISSGAGSEGTGVVTVNASGGGGGYASLTGPGESTTPGALTQAGGFTVDDSAGNGVLIESTVGISIESGFILLIQGLQVEIASTGNGTTIGSGPTDKVGFYEGSGGVAQQTVTGSRGGNAALASLLSALAAMNLIIDSSTV